MRQLLERAVVPDDLHVRKGKRVPDAREHQEETALLLGHQLQDYGAQLGTCKKVQSHGVSDQILIHYY
jgi:hypothetical protein